MTPSPTQRTSVPRVKARDYRKVADNFYAGAEAAKTFEYWNAAGVLIVHAAIAYTDTLTIKIGGVKSKGEDHMTVVDLLQKLVLLDEKGKRALNHLVRMIEEKNLVSYSGEIYDQESIEKLWKYLERYRKWVLFMLSS